VNKQGRQYRTLHGAWQRTMTSCFPNPQPAMQNPETGFNEAFARTVDIGNTIAEQDQKADLWDIADGMLAGALQFWLYSRQPCGDPSCDDCTVIATAEGRMAELRKMIEQLAAESEYFHSPNDYNVGRA
jgi:hypothetical protein